MKRIFVVTLAAVLLAGFSHIAHALPQTKNEPLIAQEYHVYTQAIAGASYTTKYNAKDANRTHNLKLAADVINGRIIMPGETFSFNEQTGDTNKEAGYKEAIVILKGKEIKGYGGGICQVSSTLYNAALGAELDIIERFAHGRQVFYVPEGLDATVAYGSVDLKFANTLDWPLIIVCEMGDGMLTVMLEKVLGVAE